MEIRKYEDVEMTKYYKNNMYIAISLCTNQCVSIMSVFFHISPKVGVKHQPCAWLLSVVEVKHRVVNQHITKALNGRKINVTTFQLKHLALWTDFKQCLDEKGTILKLQIIKCKIQINFKRLSFFHFRIWYLEFDFCYFRSEAK